MNPALEGLGLVALVAALAWFMRGKRGDEETRMPATEPVAENPETDLEEELELTEVAAVTSDGRAFVPDGKRVTLMPPSRPKDVVSADVADRREAMLPVDDATGEPVVRSRPEHLDPGDFIAARVRRGAPGVDPWRLEALGRDRNLVEYAFETEEAARAACELVTSRIVRPPRDQEGDPIAVGDEDFETARREQEAIEAELASMPETETEP